MSSGGQKVRRGEIDEEKATIHSLSDESVVSRRAKGRRGEILEEIAAAHSLQEGRESKPVPPTKVRPVGLMRVFFFS